MFVSFIYFGKKKLRAKVKRILVSASILLVLFLSACATGRVAQDEETIEEVEQPEVVEVYTPDLEVDVEKIYSWADLMPGPDSNDRFHITGKINVPASNEYSLSVLKLKTIHILQNDEQVFAIKPTVREENVGSERFKSYLFSTITGLSIGPNLDLDKLIDVELIFTDGMDNYSYRILNQPIEKTY